MLQDLYEYFKLASSILPGPRVLARRGIDSYGIEFRVRALLEPERNCTTNSSWLAMYQ